MSPSARRLKLGEPRGKYPCGWQFDPLDLLDPIDRAEFLKCDLRGTRVEVQDTDGESTLLLLDTADGHLADIDTVLAEDGPDFTDDPWHIVVGEEKHVSIEVGFHAVVIDRDESGHAVAENGHSGSYGMFTAEHLGGDRGAKCS